MDKNSRFRTLCSCSLKKCEKSETLFAGHTQLEKGEKSKSYKEESQIFNESMINMKSLDQTENFVKSNDEPQESESLLGHTQLEKGETSKKSPKESSQKFNESVITMKTCQFDQTENSVKSNDEQQQEEVTANFDLIESDDFFDHLDSLNSFSSPEFKMPNLEDFETRTKTTPKTDKKTRRRHFSDSSPEAVAQSPIMSQSPLLMAKIRKRTIISSDDEEEEEDDYQEKNINKTKRKLSSNKRKTINR
jgi:hypothetical protein